DYKVTGVQTCALPILGAPEPSQERRQELRAVNRLPELESKRRWLGPRGRRQLLPRLVHVDTDTEHDAALARLRQDARHFPASDRSEERRVGKEWGAWW